MKKHKEKPSTFFYRHPTFPILFAWGTEKGATLLAFWLPIEQCLQIFSDASSWESLTQASLYYFSIYYNVWKLWCLLCYLLRHSKNRSRDICFLSLSCCPFFQRIYIGAVVKPMDFSDSIIKWNKATISFAMENFGFVLLLKPRCSRSWFLAAGAGGGGKEGFHRKVL